MSSLLTSTDISLFANTFAQHWDTFAPFNTIVVNKKPIETITNSAVNNYPGYSDAPNQSNITYTPVNQSFNCIVMYDKPAKEAEFIQEAKIILGKGKIRIKVQQDAADYINNGITENIALNGMIYITISDDGIQNYLGKTYYYFLLERTD